MDDEPDVPFSITRTPEHGIVLLRLAGELDAATVPILSTTVDDVVADRPRSVTVDLQAVSFVDLVGLRGLLDAQATTTIAHAEFRLRSLSDFTLRIIRLAKLTGLEAALEPP